MTLRTLFAVALMLVACDDERLNPVAGDPTDAGVPPTDGPVDVPPDAPPPTKKREVSYTNPFGNVAETQNLLWDGDFEWLSPFTDQYGWIELPASPIITDVEVGPACRSGVKCARVTDHGSVIGIAVSSATLDLEASIWTRFEPPEGTPMPECAEVEAYLADLTGVLPFDDDAVLTPVAASPDANGWCQLTGLSPVRANKSYLYIENHTDVPMLLDDCVVKPVGEIPIAQQPPSAAMSAATRERALAAVRATRLPVEGAPNAARDAYRHFKSR